MRPKRIGIREAKDHLSEVIEEVERKGEVVLITRHGRPVARVSPVRAVRPVPRPRRTAGLRSPDESEVGALIQSLDSLAAEIGGHWQTGLSAVDAVREQRQ